MKIPIFLVGLVLVSLLAGACLVAILIYYDPFASSWLIFLLLYLGLLISSASFFTLIGFFVRRFSKKRKILSISQVTHFLETSFRQGILLAIILITALALQSQRLLYWWIILILVFLIFIIEWRLAKR